MTDLYPLKFEPILKEKIWGGDTLQRHFGKKAERTRKIGESWEISGLREDLSVVSNGFLAGNTIEELIEVYMGDITGDIIYDRFGVEFPLLIKLIDAREDLSIQVHPGNELAMKLHNAYGKTEMWYILEASPDSNISNGFSKTINRDILLKHIKENTLINIINTEKVTVGDSYFIPSGTVHSIGTGTVIAEIQQASDITYRIFDWNRKGPDGSTRELNIDLAIDAINYTSSGNSNIQKKALLNNTVNIVTCEYFSTNIIYFNKSLIKDYNLIDSFIIYLCIEGEFIINWEDKKEIVAKGETVLLPAMIKDVVLEPKGVTKLLEIFIDELIKK
jgi:mannose-6-phosphate isomerase